MSFLDRLNELEAARSTKETKKEELKDPGGKTSGLRINEETKEAPANGETKEGGWTPSYAAPWPDALDLGLRSVHPFEPCADCGDGTWVQYGPRPLCLACA